MPKVHVLPEHIASQIAAGEVVERPASVVKELVENSIDAGATQVEIAIGSECRDIRVADNGSGMEADDAVLAFQRHATSKLASADDLWNLRTMGFRGEALPSIASISRLTCLTRCHDKDTGTKVEVHEGKVTANETGCAKGTVIEVCDLFHNVPARLKFLKKASTEFAHISETVQSLAIAHPLVAIQLINDGEVVLRTSGSGKLAKVLVETGIFSGKEELRQVKATDLKHGMAIYGYIAAPTHFRGDRKAIVSIVNNRPVRCPITYKALEYAFSDLIPRGRHPLAAITITLDASEVDINVHPTKKEIKYSHGNDVYLALQRALVEAARMPVTAHGAQEEAEETAIRPVFTSDSFVKESTPSVRVEQMNLSGHLSYAPAQQSIRSHTVAPSQTAAAPATLPSGWHIIGYLHNTYILVETPEGLSVIEQHIAHERTLYERILASQNEPGRISESAQKLISAIPLTLSAEQKSSLEGNVEALKNIGFDFSFDHKASPMQVFCTQIPAELATKEYQTAVQKIVEDLCLTDKAQVNLEATKSLACQAAIKNGMRLAHMDIIKLLSEWYKTPRNDTCPHGRPVRLNFSMDKLFQMFHPA